MERELTVCDIAIVIPTLNEEEAIGRVMDEIKEAMRQYKYQVIVVDGHSTDNTVKIAKERGAVVLYQVRKGYGDALQLGFKYAYRKLKTPITVMMDADGTYDPKDIPKLIKPIIEGKADLTIGNRFKNMEKGAMTLTNKVGNKILSWMARKILKISIKDTQSGFRAFRTSTLKLLNLKTKGMPFATEMLAEATQAAVRILEVPISYRRRIGKRKLNPLKDGLMILSVILRLARDYQPLIFFGGPGIVFILGGILIGINVVVEWLTTGVITRLASVVLSALLIMTGIQLVSLGLVADMIKRR